MTMEEIASLQIELVALEAKERRNKDLLGFAYTEIDENHRNEIELEMQIIEQRIEEIRGKLENAVKRSAKLGS